MTTIILRTLLAAALLMAGYVTGNYVHGPYEVRTRGENGGGLYRYDSYTGKTWVCVYGKWRLIDDEPGADPAK